MRLPNNVSFDLDRALVDSAHDTREGVRLAVSEAGIRTCRPLTEAVVGSPIRGMLEAWRASWRNPPRANGYWLMLRFRHVSACGNEERGRFIRFVR